MRVTYLLYPGLPVVRKRLAVRNAGTADLRLEGVEVERLHTALDVTHTWTMASYGRQKRVGPYAGDWDDTVVTLHQAATGRGIVLGNEAPGVLKRTTAFLDGHTATIGLTRPQDPFPFRRWLKPGETWESPWVFVAPYAGTNDPYAALNGPVNAFVRRHMGVRLADAKRKPVLVYNTWMHWSPSQEQVAEAPLRELAQAASECGAEEFVIDAGWYALDASSPPGGANADDWMVRVGDYRPDPRRFPNGLGPVFDHVRSLGMRPGLWISLATANHRSKVFREHPEWFVRDDAGRPVNLHEEPDPANARTPELATACMATGWSDYIGGKILDLVERHGLAYAKLDLSMVTSAYRYEPATSGCQAKATRATATARSRSARSTRRRTLCSTGSTSGRPSSSSTARSRRWASCSSSTTRSAPRRGQLALELRRAGAARPAARPADGVVARPRDHGLRPRHRQPAPRRPRLGAGAAVGGGQLPDPPGRPAQGPPGRARDDPGLGPVAARHAGPPRLPVLPRGRAGLRRAGRGARGTPSPASTATRARAGSWASSARARPSPGGWSRSRAWTRRPRT